MTLALFFEGTGQGVAGNITNVTRLRDACVEDASQRLHLESGPGTHLGALVLGKIAGTDGMRIFRAARRWFESAYRSLPSNGIGTNVFLFGFSRGASLARHFAQWLDKLGIAVEYLGLWDTVDAMPGIDVDETCAPNVRRVRHAIARDEARRFFAVVPIVSEVEGKVVQRVFPGCHSDVGGLYDDNHVVADVALAWVARGAVEAGLRLRPGIRLTQVPSAPIKLHSSHQLASNLWGAFKPVKRILKGIPRHPICKGL